MNKKKTCRKNKKQHACIKLKLREKGQISINAAYITLKNLSTYWTTYSPIVIYL